MRMHEETPPIDKEVRKLWLGITLHNLGIDEFDHKKYEAFVKKFFGCFRISHEPLSNKQYQDAVCLSIIVQAIALFGILFLSASWVWAIVGLLSPVLAVLVGFMISMVVKAEHEGSVYVAMQLASGGWAAALIKRFCGPPRGRKLTMEFSLNSAEYPMEMLQMANRIFIYCGDVEFTVEKFIDGRNRVVRWFLVAANKYQAFRLDPMQEA